MTTRSSLGLVAVALLFACSPHEQPPLRVAAAASLREVAEAIGARFSEAHPGRKAELSFGASSELAAQLRAGAPIDVLLSADEEVPRALEKEGLANSLRPFASNRLVVIASAEAAAHITQPEDLKSVERIAMPAPAVPVGHYAREWLKGKGLAEATEPHIVQTENVRATLAAVEAGNADVAIVYVTDARVAKSARVAFAIPDAEQPRIVYLAAVSAATKQPELAARFLDFLLEAQAAALLRDAGFGPPGTPASP